MSRSDSSSLSPSFDSSSSREGPLVNTSGVMSVCVSGQQVRVEARPVRSGRMVSERNREAVDRFYVLLREALPGLAAQACRLDAPSQEAAAPLSVPAIVDSEIAMPRPPAIEDPVMAARPARIPRGSACAVPNCARQHAPGARGGHMRPNPEWLRGWPETWGSAPVDLAGCFLCPEHREHLKRRRRSDK